MTVEEKQHSWRALGANAFGRSTGELIEFLVVGTAVVPMENAEPVPVPTLVVPANR